MPVLTLQRVDTRDTIDIHYTTGGETLGWLRRKVKSGIVCGPKGERVRLVKLLLDDQLLGGSGGGGGDDDDDEGKPLDYFTVSAGPWLVRPVFLKPKMVVFVKALDGKTLAFEVFPEDTVGKLKKKIHSKEGIRPDRQRLLYSNKILQDTRAISDYNVPREATIHLALSLPGGLNATAPIKFVDMTNGNGLKARNWSKGAPSWRITKPGLTLEGICTNESCKACSFKVVIGWGQRNFDFFYDEHRCVCPLCREYVRPVTCGFNNTWWNFCGSKKVGPGHAPQSVSGVWKYAGDKHHYFDEKECGEVDWGRLKILVSSKDPRDARSEF